MKKPLPLITLCFLVSLFQSGCETTLDYGYYVETFDDESIDLIFAMSDEAIGNQDLSAYSDLLGPNYSSVDKTNGPREMIYRYDYLDLVEDVFKTAKYIEMTTVVMSIEYTEPGRRALVKIQEEEKRTIGSNAQHFTSLIDVVVGCEDGWIFFEKTTRTSIQVIDE